MYSTTSNVTIFGRYKVLLALISNENSSCWMFLLCSWNAIFMARPYGAAIFIFFSRDLCRLDLSSISLVGTYSSKSKTSHLYIPKCEMQGRDSFHNLSWLYHLFVSSEDIFSNMKIAPWSCELPHMAASPDKARSWSG